MSSLAILDNHEAFERLFIEHGVILATSTAYSGSHPS
jgi:hypothetical protein